MDKMKTRIILALMIMVTLLASVSSAWRINQELKDEVEAKRAAVRKAPNDPHAHFDLAITYAYTNNIQDGWNELKNVNDLDPAFRAEALNLYIRKVTAEPDDWRLRFRLAFAYYFNDKKKDAIRELENVLLLDPYNVWAYGYISLIYGEMGDIDNAMISVKKGLRIDSNVAALHLLLSEGYYKKGDSWKGCLERMEALRLRALGF
jgi:tetratricopeptide (TPR) repeat protein